MWTGKLLTVEMVEQEYVFFDANMGLESLDFLWSIFGD
jgi:hypothetical protein